MIHRVCHLWTRYYPMDPPTSLRLIKEDRKIKNLISALFVPAQTTPASFLLDCMVDQIMWSLERRLTKKILVMSFRTLLKKGLKVLRSLSKFRPILI